TEIGGERQSLPLARYQLAHQGVHLQIRAPETINRLLRVADEKQLARLKRHFSPFCSPRFSLSQKENNFCLQWIGVLKFINKEEKKSILKIPPHLEVVLEQVARYQEQISKVETPALSLLFLICTEVSVEPRCQLHRQIMAPDRARLPVVF